MHTEPAFYDDMRGAGSLAEWFAEARATTDQNFPLTIIALYLQGIDY